MEHLIENKKCYASNQQRDVLLTLITNSIIENSFFLTGGTSLSVFYLHHRTSNDIDFFTVDNIDISEIDFWIKTIWKGESIKIRESPNFLSIIIKEVKVDFVIDSLSNKENREKVLFENNHYLLVDTLSNIASNKFCAIVSRTEPKDFIDFYFIQKIFPSIKIEDLYNDAKKKDAIFDDPPTAAFQIEEGIDFLKENLTLFPKIFMEFDSVDFFEFYKSVVDWLYKRLNI